MADALKSRSNCCNRPTRGGVFYIKKEVRATTAGLPDAKRRVSSIYLHPKNIIIIDTSQILYYKTLHGTGSYLTILN